MSTVIDTLIVELSLDPTKFNKGERDAVAAAKKLLDEATAAGKAIESQGKKIEEFFNTVKRGALEMTAIFLGGKGAKEFLGFITNLDAQTDRLSKTMNMNVQELSAWQGAAKQTGGSAEGITSALQGMSSAMNTFMLTGQGPFLGVVNQLGLSLFDQNKKLKTSGEMLLEIADAVKKISASDPARAAALLSMIPGANQDSINLMINGRKALEDLLAESRKAGTATRESADAAKEYQQNLALLEQTATGLGRSIVTYLVGPMVEAMGKLKVLIDLAKTDWKRALVQAADPKLAELIYGKDAFQDVAQPKGVTAPHAPTQTMDLMSGSITDASNRAKVIKYIRAAAIARDINPDVAVAVAKSEGLNQYTGDRGSSFGPFQLHYGGVASGGMAVGGLGDTFTKKTGLDARDPATMQQQIDFALDEAKKNGWGAWHGWKGLPRAGLGGRMGAAASPGATPSGGGNTQNITIGKVEVNAPNAKDADGIASELPAALKRQSWAAPSNYGQV